MQCCANADGIISRQSFQDGILKSQLMIRFFERLALDVENDLDELFDVVDKDRQGILAYDKIASLYLELQNILSDPMKVAVIRGAKDAEERMAYIARMFDHGSVVRPTPGEMEDLLRRNYEFVSDQLKNTVAQGASKKVSPRTDGDGGAGVVPKALTNNVSLPPPPVNVSKDPERSAQKNGGSSGGEHPAATNGTAEPAQLSTPLINLSNEELAMRKLALTDQLAKEHGRHAEAVAGLKTQVQVIDQCLLVRL